MFFACSRDSRSTEAYLVAEIITLIYLTVTRTVPAASLKQLLERNFAENYDGWWRGGEELSNFPLKFDPEKERKKEEEKKMVTVIEFNASISHYIHIRIRIGISGWVIGNTKAVQSGGRVNRSPTVATSPRLAALEHKLFMLVKISWLARFLAKHVRQ